MDSSAEIEHWREKIDAVDAQLLELVNRRVGFALEIGRLKRAVGLPVYNREREEQIQRNVSRNNQGPLSDDAIMRLFTRIIEETRRLEQEVCSEGTGDGHKHAQ
ncbi:chorismate mutase [bacterium]|nr:chorismate mutase [bacterium]